MPFFKNLKRWNPPKKEREIETLCNLLSVRLPAAKFAALTDVNRKPGHGQLGNRQTGNGKSAETRMAAAVTAGAAAAKARSSHFELLATKKVDFIMYLRRAMRTF